MTEQPIFTFKEAKISALHTDQAGDIVAFQLKVYTEQGNILTHDYALTDAELAEIERGSVMLEGIVLKQTERAKDALLVYLEETTAAQGWTVDANGNYTLDNSQAVAEPQPEEVFASDTILQSDIDAGEIEKKPEPDPEPAPEP